MSLLKTSQGPRPGSIVEFLQNDRPHAAYVVEEQAGRLRLFTASRRETKLAANRVLPWSGPLYSGEASRADMESRLDLHQARREEIEKGLDILELWELAQGEVDHAPVTWFAGLLWDQPGPDELAALGRAMLAARTHFKFHPPEFEVFPKAKVEERLEHQRIQHEMERLSSLGTDFLRALWDRVCRPDAPRPPEPDPEISARLTDLLKDRLANPHSSGTEDLWKMLTKGLPEHPCLALLLAQAWELVPRHYTSLLDEADYAADDSWSAPFAGEIVALTQVVTQTVGQAVDQAAIEPGFVSIDAETTRDIDDAFKVAATDEGFLVSIALARPCLHWEFGSPLDRAVMHRATSLYLPEGSSHMMPEALGLRLFSLLADGPRPALILDIRLDHAGQLLGATPRTGFVQVANTTYEKVETALAEGSDPDLALAMQAAGKAFEARLARGAVVIKKPDPHLVLTQDPDTGETRVELTLKPRMDQAELVVSEFMILANWAVADLAHKAGAVLLHRTQDIAIGQEMAGVWERAEDIYRVVRVLSAPLLETRPRPHAGLGLPAYAPSTSPLRRYPDFLNVAQLCHLAETGQPRFSAQDLEALLPLLGSRLEAVSQIQRFRPRYWRLVHLAQNLGREYPAVMVDENGPMATLALPELQIYTRVPKNMLGDKLYPGKPCLVVFKRVDPLTNELKVAQVLDD